MTGNHPAEPVVDGNGKTEGGFAELARQLNLRHPGRRRPISRQLVHKWWMFRHYNRFPEAIDSRGNTSGGKGRPVFDIDSVVTWYADYRKYHAAQGESTASRSQRNGDTGSLAA